jgi:curli biogenesis system outer membrane secretion channel CsgG
MRFFVGMRFIGLFSVLAIFLGCASGSVEQTKGPTVSDAQAVSAMGSKARIAVAQFVNNSGDPATRELRERLRRAAQARNDARRAMDQQKKWFPYLLEVQYWQEKLAAEGPEAAGPPPEPPEDMPSSSPYTVTVSDPVAGAIRDMMINAIFNCGKFIVLEREAIDKINWEQEFSGSGLVGEKTRIAAGEIEGAELLLIGSLNTCEAKASGGSIGGVFDSVTAQLLGLPYTTETTEGGVSWEKAEVAMELRLVDARTSRVVAATTVEGKARSVLFGARKTEYSWNAGALPSGFSFYQNTPVEEAFRKMIDATVEFLITKTPDKYYHR